MYANEKKKALAQTVDLARAALGCDAGSLNQIAHPDNVAEFLDVVYKKLCELHDDSIRND